MMRIGAYPLAACLILTACAMAEAAAPASSAWDASPQARARLVSAGASSAGHYLVAIEVDLQGDAHTYWRTPGDTGVPPEISFDHSDNLAKAEIRWPAPAKLEEAGSEIFGFEHELVLPVEVTASAPDRPVDLDVAMNYATCEKICVPAKAHLRLTLAPGEGPGADAARVQEWLARVPKPLDAQGAPKLSVTSLPAQKDGKPAWHVAIAPPMTSPVVFPEAAEGWYLVAQNVGPEGFDLAAAEAPSKTASLSAAQVTIVSGAKAYAGTLHLDAPARKP